MSDGWYADPYERHELRYFGSGRWTEHVSDRGTQAVDRIDLQAGTDGIETWWRSRRAVGVYLGSHPARPERIENLGLGFVSLGFVAVGAEASPVLTLGWTDFTTATVETSESIRSRVTATRVIMFGAIGLLAKKTTRSAFLTLADPAGEWVFGIEDQDAAGLWGELQPVKARMPDRFRFGAPLFAPPAVEPPPAPAAAGAATVRERLQTLDSLRADGVITDDEWARRRAEILASI